MPPVSFSQLGTLGDGGGEGGGDGGGGEGGGGEGGGGDGGGEGGGGEAATWDSVVMVAGSFSHEFGDGGAGGELQSFPAGVLGAL